MKRLISILFDFLNLNYEKDCKAFGRIQTIILYVMYMVVLLFVILTIISRIWFEPVVYYFGIINICLCCAVVIYLIIICRMSDKKEIKKWTYLYGTNLLGTVFYEKFGSFQNIPGWFTTIFSKANEIEYGFRTIIKTRQKLDVKTIKKYDLTYIKEEEEGGEEHDI